MSEVQTPNPTHLAPGKAHRQRYWRLLSFFARAFLRILFFDVFLNRPGLRALRSDPTKRWVMIARRFRELAVRWGGVLIKLGQYLSTRVDILPFEVTRELADLQDEAPAVAFPAIRQLIEQQFGRPLQEVFSVFMEYPLGAASFAQAHEAQLPDGQPVVVKCLRPGIEELVDTDLRALAKALGWLKWWPAINRRVDLDWLQDEFATTTRRELNLEDEGRHAERFAADFAQDGGVHIPKIYWPFTGRRVLTEENVGYIKVTDLAQLRANGIDPKEVASKIYRIYMQQMFVHDFVHADPHPGNLFVRPLSRDPSLFEEAKSRAAEAAAAVSGQGDANPLGAPFQILLIDFGMVAEIPSRLRNALRKYLIGMGSRDAAMVVESLRDAGTLLPGADLAQIEEALDAIFDRFWGVDLGRISKMGLSEAGALWKEFGQLLRETPIQVQVDLMFVGRATELLIGLCRSLDDDFNPWTETVPFAERLAVEATGDWRAQTAEALRQLRALAKLPAEVSRAVTLAQRGRLTVRTAPSPESRRQSKRYEKAFAGVAHSVMAGALVIGGAILHGSDPQLALGLMSAGGVLFVLSRFLVWR